MISMKHAVSASILLTGLVIGAASAQGTKQTNQSEVQAHYNRAAEALSKGQAEVAVAEFNAILRLDPANPQARANLGVIAYKKGDYAQAKTLFETALAHDPALWDAKALLGLCRMRLGEAEPGLDLLETSFPHVKNPEVKLDAGSAIISAHETAGTLRAALPALGELQTALPANPDVLYIAYRVYSRLASEQVQALTSTAPDSARTYQVYGEASMTQDDFIKARAQFERAVERDPNLPGAHYQLGLAILTNAQDVAARRDAEAAFRAELRINPSDAHAEYQLGEVLRLGNQLREAEQCYTEALRLQPAFAEAQVSLGIVLAQEGREAESLRYLLAATRSDPDNETAHYRLSRAYRSAGRAEDANREMASFQRLHRLHEAGATSSGSSAPTSAAPDR